MPTLRLDLDKSKRERLEKLAASCGTTLDKNLMDYALSTLEWIVQMMQAGYSIEAINYVQRHNVTLTLPFLPTNMHESGNEQKTSPFTVIEGGKGQT